MPNIPDLTAENMKYLSADQALEDTVAFVNAFSKENGLPSCTKWVLFGGSYTGNLVAWFRDQRPDIFWAAHSSSGPLQAKEDFFEYGQAVKEGFTKYGAPKATSTCLDRWTRSIKLLDDSLTNDEQETRKRLGINTKRIGDVTGLFGAFAGLAQNGKFLLLLSPQDFY